MLQKCRLTRPEVNSLILMSPWARTFAQISPTLSSGDMTAQLPRELSSPRVACTARKTVPGPGQQAQACASV